MEGLQLVISVVSVLTAGFALVVSVFILVNYRNIVYLSYILLYSALFLFTAFLTAQNLLPVLAVRLTEGLPATLDAAATAAKALLIFCIPFLFHYLYEVPHRRARNAVWACLSLGVIGLVVLRRAVGGGLERRLSDYLVEAAALVSVYCYLLVLFFRHREKMRAQEIRPLHRVYIILVSVYVVARCSQQVLSAGGVIKEPLVADNLLVPVLFIIWNAFFLRFIARFLQVKPIAVPGVDVSSFDRLNRADVTDRERDIIRELLTGATVSELAGRLFISEHTAKTHVKNIYQKLGVRNRVELLNLIRSGAEKTAPPGHSNDGAGPASRPG
jgi:DNA-binding CsgD family transcriptional regulator